MILLPQEMTEALKKPHIYPIYAVRLDWPGGVVRLHSEIGRFKHFPFDNNEIYFGIGNLGNIGDITYGDGNDTAPSVTLELSAFDEPTRMAVMAGGYQGRSGQIYMLAMSQDGSVRAWVQLFDGQMDSASIKQGEQNTIQLPLVSPDDGLDTGLNWRCTNESHKADFTGDEFYCFTEHMETLGLYWGNKKDGTPLRNL